MPVRTLLHQSFEYIDEGLQACHIKVSWLTQVKMAIHSRSCKGIVACNSLLFLLQWVDPIELHGIGQYASDAYFMFCRGLWQEVSPSDKDLLKYQQWLHSTNGEGTGLERDELRLPALPSP